MRRIVYTLLTLLLAACGSSSSLVAPTAHASGWMMLLSDESSQFIYTIDQDKNQVWRSMMGRTPSWTPDGHVIYVWTGVNPGQIYIAALDGSSYRAVQTPPFPDIVKPQQAQDGTIIFIAGGALWRVNPDGSNLVKIEPSAMAPSLAPATGTWLTFTLPGGQNEIWRVNLDGSGLRMLTDPSNPYYPSSNASAISFDETKIAVFTGQESGRGIGFRNVALIPATGGPKTFLTKCVPVPTPGSCLTADNPFWWPGDIMVGFDMGGPSADLDGTWAVNPDGTSPHQVWPVGRGAGANPIRLTP